MVNTVPSSGLYEREKRILTLDEPMHLYAADIDADQFLDIVIVCQQGSTSDGKVQVRRGNSQYSYTLIDDYSAGNAPQSMCILDYDLDGDNDIIVGNGNGTIGILENILNGNFNDVVSFTFGLSTNKIWKLIAADLDGDGYDDLVVIRRDESWAKVIWNNGASPNAFHAVYDSLKVGDDPRCCDVADFNNDGLIDVVVASHSGSNAVSVFHNQGDRSFDIISVASTLSHEPLWVSVADVDNDGHVDLVFALDLEGSSVGYVSVLENDDSEGHYTSPEKLYEVLPNSQYSLTIGDFDGNDQLDVATQRHENTGSLISVLLANGSSFSTYYTFDGGGSGYEGYHISSADLNGDGVLEILHSNVGKDSFTIISQYNTTWYADSDGDNYGDPNSSVTIAVKPSGYVLDNTDCDDTDSFTHPEAAPNDSPTACMRDADEDGYGDIDATGDIVAGTDCDDTDSFTHPEAAPNDNPTDCMRDADEDDYGDIVTTGDIVAGTDCDDTDEFVNPGAVEVCNGLDDNCDGVSDEGFADGDEDGVGEPCDNCPYDVNLDQADIGDPGIPDNNIGDACDCCSVRVGDVNDSGEDEPTIGDVAKLVDHLFIDKPLLVCVAEADINQSGGLYPSQEQPDSDITIGDVADLVNYLFIATPAYGVLPDCF